MQKCKQFLKQDKKSIAFWSKKKNKKINKLIKCWRFNNDKSDVGLFQTDRLLKKSIDVKANINLTKHCSLRYAEYINYRGGSILIRLDENNCQLFSYFQTSVLSVYKYEVIKES